MTTHRPFIHPVALAGVSLVVALTTWGCEESTMSPIPRRPSYSNPTDPVGGTGELSDTTIDNCTDLPGNQPNKCHHTTTQPQPLAGDSNYVCPGGCWSFPLTLEMEDSTFDALGLTATTTECAEVYDYMSFQLRSQVVRYTRDPASEFGDTHMSKPPGTGPDYRNAIHLDYMRFMTRGKRELAKTMMHEGYHGWRNRPDRGTPEEDRDAEDFANRCVP